MDRASPLASCTVCRSQRSQCTSLRRTCCAPGLCSRRQCAGCMSLCWPTIDTQQALCSRQSKQVPLTVYEGRHKRKGRHALFPGAGGGIGGAGQQNFRLQRGSYASSLRSQRQSHARYRRPVIRELARTSEGSCVFCSARRLEQLRVRSGLWLLILLGHNQANQLSGLQMPND